MATNPSFASIPRLEMVTISTANANKNGTGTIATLFTAGSNGSRVDKLIIKATQTTTSGAVRFFIGESSTYRLIFEQAVSAQTSSGTDNSYYKLLDSTNSFLPIVLKSGQFIGVSTQNSETFNVFAIGGDF